MKKIILSVILALTAMALPAQVPGQEDLLVTMPVPPESMSNLTQRCNFIVDRYWKTFNPKSSFSSLERLDKTMGQFFAVVPYASADTVFQAIDALTAAVGKAKAENLITLAKIAERWTGCDTAQYLSDQLYTPFVAAVVNNKKAKGPERARFEAQYKALVNSTVGAKVADFKFTRPDGSTATLYGSSKAPHKVIFFYDPDCMDCRLAKARLSADYVIDGLVKGHLIDIIAIYPDEASDEWKKDAESLPDYWIKGAYPDADLYYTMRQKPEIYYLNGEFKINAKDVAVDGLMNGFRNLLDAAKAADARAAETQQSAGTESANPEAQQ